MTNDERSRLEVIEAKVDTVLVKLTYIEKAVGDHEARIRSTEKWRYAIPVSVLLALAAIVGHWVRI